MKINCIRKVLVIGSLVQNQEYGFLLHQTFSHITSPLAMEVVRKSTCKAGEGGSFENMRGVVFLGMA